MKTLHLHGSLAEDFGSTFQMNVSGPAEAIRLMECNFPGRFVKAVINKWFHIRCGTREVLDTDELLMSTSADDIHIEPILGGGIKGLFGLFLGLPGLGAAFAPLGIPLGGAFGAAGASGGLLGLGGALGGFGTILQGVALLGVIYLISTALQPDAPEDNEGPDERASFLFDGAVNATRQGGPVPLVYGELRTGSVLIAGGIDIEDLSV